MRVAIVMGSTSDIPKVEPAIQILKDHGVKVDVRCLSAHRAHTGLSAFIEETNNNGTEVIIAAAGMAAALPGVVASQTVLPVIGVPLSGSVLDGTDALYSIVQMPPGIPVETVAINGDVSVTRTYQYTKLKETKDDASAGQDVAATDNSYLTALHNGSIGIILICLHKIGASEELVCRIYALIRFTRNTHKVRQTCA